MLNYTNSYSAQYNKGFDEGLRQYMLKLYNYMAMALLVTGVMAFTTLNFPPLMNLMYNIGPNGEFMGMSGFGTLITFAPLGISLFFFMGLGRMTVSTANTMFWIYAAVMGMSLSNLGLIYTHQSIAKTFFICASVFGGMSLYGYSTKKDLTSMGSFLVMGLIGLIIASIVNIFLKSAAVEFATSLIGVGIFMGLVAWDTQRLKDIYYQALGDEETREKISIMGAFTLYLDFINLFLHLLRFFGDRRD